jgi:hypothetical protein
MDAEPGQQLVVALVDEELELLHAIELNGTAKNMQLN